MNARFSRALPALPALVLTVTLLSVWWRRFGYPFDLEWMEAGMLAHAWRVDQGLPLYVRPNVDFIPYIYPPGYSWTVAGLAQVFGLSLQLGRAVSILSILAAATALAFGLRRAGASIGLALGVGVAFLGTYPQAGAFYDLVRPDALSLALLAWAIVLGLEEDRRAPVAAGLLLAAAFLVKQSAAVAGLPILLGLALRGWRPAVSFAAASVLPALGAIALLQWTTEGNFLTWLVKVPGTQQLIWVRGWLDTPREWGTALPVAAAAVAAALCWDAAANQRTLPLPLAAAGPTWFGIAVAWWMTYEPPPPDAPVFNVPAAVAYWALAATPAALAVRLVGGLLDRLSGSSNLPSWRTVYGTGLLLTVGAMSALMRVHDGGFINVHTPLFWCLTAAFGAILLELERRQYARTAAVALALQLTWSLALLRPALLVPTAEDTAIGWRIVEEVRTIDGPILSPFSAWIPVYAGKPPSLHAQGVWDVNYVGGPYRDDLVVIEQALRDHHWAMIIGGQNIFLGDLTKHYEVREELLPEQDPRFMPPTGLKARPWRVLVPRP